MVNIVSVLRAPGKHFPGPDFPLLRMGNYWVGNVDPQIEQNR